MKPKGIMWKLFALIGVFLTVASINPMTEPAQAQNDIILTLSVRSFIKEFMSDEIIENFEAAHPGVDVVVVANDTFSAGSPVSDIETYLDTVEELVTSGDVVMVDDSFLTPEAIRAGYFLDLTPLTSVDSSLNVEDILPVAWQSFQWNNGTWGLPLSIDPVLITYEPTAFDEANLPYPDASWTFDDYEAAIRQLAQIDSAGNVTRPGMMITGNNLGIFLRTLLGTNLVDVNDALNGPALSNPELEALLERWQALEDEGLIASDFGTDGTIAPLRIGGPFDFFAVGPDTDNQQPTSRRALLPGGTGGVTVQGLAVSGGTQYPELAYELAKYLSSDAQASFSFIGGSVQARRSVSEAQATGGFVIGGPVSEEDQAVIDEAVENALPISETNYFDYLETVLQKMTDEGLDAHTALQEVEAQIVTNLQTADERRTTTTLFVNTPAPSANLAPGEIALKFGMVSQISPLPNQDQWNQLIEQFVNDDPDVGQVILETELGVGGDLVSEMAEQYECFVLPSNSVPDADLSVLLSLDPFLLDDPDFDPNDVVGNALTQLQRDNRTWAYPLEIRPQVLWYNAELFNQYGLYDPATGWTAEAFADALRSLQPYLDADEASFGLQGPGSNALLMLIAAYGGLPIDFRTNPPTLNFTDPTNVEAIRQVLDLAKEGLIDYQALDFRGGGGVIAFGGDQAPVYSGGLSPFDFGGGGRVAVFIGGGPGDGPGDNVPEENPYRPTTYPSGNVYTPVSFQIGTGYISANAENPDACYRWLKAIASQPSLLTGMPARRSLIDDPDVAATQGEDLVNFYRQYDAMLQDPTAVQFAQQGTIGNFAGEIFFVYWLNRAFDRYVLEDADLELELTDAQMLTQAYLDCTASIPPYDPAVYEEPFEYAQQLSECAARVDPDLADVFGTRQAQ